MEISKDLTSCVWESTFCHFLRIYRRVWEYFLEILKDLMSRCGALFATFGVFNVVVGSTFKSEIGTIKENLEDFDGVEGCFDVWKEVLWILTKSPRWGLQRTPQSETKGHPLPALQLK